MSYYSDDDDYSSHGDDDCSSEDSYDGDMMARAPLAARRPAYAPVAAGVVPLYRTPRTVVNLPANAWAIKQGLFTNTAERKPFTVTYHISMGVTLASLKAQADGGKVVTASWKNGFNKVTFSNPEHNSDEARALGDVDILSGEATVQQSNSLGAALVIGTSVPLPHKNASPSALSFSAPCNTPIVETFSVTDRVKAFIAQFPGQTADDLDDFIYPAGPDANNEMHIQVKPANAALHFYHMLPEVLANPKLRINANAPGVVDIKGRAYIPKELGDKTKVLGKVQMKGGMGYGNVTDHTRMVFTFGLTPEHTRTRVTLADGKSVEATVPLQENLYKACLAAAMRVRGAAQPDPSKVMFKLESTITLPYLKVPKNFGYQ